MAADEKGELRLNGRRTDKPDVRRFVGRIMGVKESVLTLAAGMDAGFVFTAARVEAKWGATGRLHGLTDDQLYITEKDFGKNLKPEEISQIAQAFLSLAHLEKEFGRGKKSKPEASRSILPSAGLD